MDGSSHTERYHRIAADIGAAIARLAAVMEADEQRRRDLVQEIHLQIWRSLDGFDGRCSERTWALRVAHNVAASHVDAERRRRRLLVVSLDDEIPSGEPGGDLPCESLDRKRAMESLERLIRVLPSPDRHVLILYLEGMNLKEIGEVAGLSPNAVSIRVHRIKGWLARSLARRKGGEL